MADEEEPQETEPEPEEAPDETSLTERITEIVERTVTKVLGEKLPKMEGPKKGRMTYRDEEESISALVTEKVAELREKEKAAGEKHDEGGGSEKAPPEPVPAQPPGRRIEKVMGWS